MNVKLLFVENGTHTCKLGKIQSSESWSISLIFSLAIQSVLYLSLHMVQTNPKKRGEKMTVFYCIG
jgi:hypothetical protein